MTETAKKKRGMPSSFTILLALLAIVAVITVIVSGTSGGADRRQRAREGLSRQLGFPAHRYHNCPQDTGICAAIFFILLDLKPGLPGVRCPAGTAKKAEGSGGGIPKSRTGFEANIM